MPRSSEYQKSQEGKYTVFRVIPAGVPKFGTMIGIGVVCLLMGLGMMGDGAGIVFLAMGGFSLWYGWTRDLRPKEHRKESSFRVSADAIEVDGKTYKTGDIHRMILRNAITDQELGVEMQNISAAQASGMAYRAKVGRVANALTLESGGKSTLVAGGMDATTAYGLLREVSNVMGMEERTYAN